MDRTITGTPGPDSFAGTAEDEEFKGLAGDDFIDGGAGNDRLIGNEGNDTLLGGAGDDRLFGCEDDDILDGGAGRDFLNAGSGRDTLIFRAAENNPANGFDFYDGHNGRDRLVLVLTAAEFAAARTEIDGFLAFIERTTGSNGESGGSSADEFGDDGAGGFYFFESLGLAARRIERLQVIVEDEVVIGPDPDAVDDALSGDADGPIAGTVRGNDVVPFGSTFELVEGPADGVFAFASDGGFSFTPGAAFAALGAGQTAQRSFTYALVSPDGERDEAVVTITIVGVNDAPVVQTSPTLRLTEDDAPDTLDLLAGVTDADGDAISIIGDVTIDPDDAAGLSDPDENGVVTIDPSAYDSLAAGETQVITLSYTVGDGNGGEDEQTATITIVGVNDAPTVAAALTLELGEDDAPDTLNLFAGADDVDASDTLQLGPVTVDPEDALGLSGPDDNGVITVDPSAYGDLNTGESRVITLTYDIIDGNGGVVPQTATITIVGEDEPNEAPVVTTLFASESEDADSFVVNLLANATDPDGDALSVVDGSVSIKVPDLPTIAEGSPLLRQATQNGDTIVVDLSRYQSLAVGEEATIEVSYSITDGEAIVPTRAELTVIGANDRPEVEGPLAFEAAEGEGVRLFDLLRGASDIDTTDVLSVTDLDGEVEGVTQVGNSLRVDTAAFADLDQDETREIELTYLVDDGNGGTREQTATLVITGLGTVDARDDDFGVEVGETVSGDVGDNDTPAMGLTFTLDDGVSRGTLDLGEDGEFTFDPGDDFGFLGDGETATETFTYRVDGPGMQSDVATVTITITGVGSNSVPQRTASVAAVTEDDDVFTIALADFVGPDAEGDALTFSNVSITDSLGTAIDPGDIFVDDGVLRVDPSVFNFLNDGQNSLLSVSFDVSDGTDTARSTLRQLVIGVEDTPEASAPITLMYSESEAVDNITADILAAISDADQGDDAILRVVEIGSAGFTTPPDGVTLSGTSVFFDPSSYAASLDAGEMAELVVFVRVDDDFGDVNTTSTVQQVNITVTGEGGETPPGNSPPVVTSPISAAITEDEEFADSFSSDTTAEFRVDLLEFASDPDGDPLFVEEVGSTYVGPGTVAFDLEISTDESILSIFSDQEAFQGLGAGETAEFVLTFNVLDGNDNSTETTASITITGVNDAPDTQLISFEVFETDSAFSFDPLQEASDLDINDELFFDGTFTTTGDDAGLFYNTMTGEFEFDPSAYTALGGSEFETIEITYTISDGNGASVDQVVEITVSGVDSAANPPGNFSLSPSIFTDGTVEGQSVVQSQVLSSFVTSPTGGTIAFVDFVAGPFAGLAYDPVGDVFTFDPSDPAYDSLTEGEIQELTAIARVEDGLGGFADVEVSMLITGVNDAPNVPGDLSVAASGFSSFEQVNLLQDVTDADGTFLAVSNLVLPEGLEDGFSFDDSSGVLEIFPGDEVFAFIPDGVTQDIIVTFDIIDDLGAVTSRQLTVSIDGFNNSPVVNATHNISLAVEVDPGAMNQDVKPDDGVARNVAVDGGGFEDSRSRTIDLLAGVSDPDDGDTVSVTGIQISSPSMRDYSSAISLDSDGNLVIDFTNFAVSTTEDVTVTYTLDDGNAFGMSQGTVVISLVEITATDSSGVPDNAFPEIDPNVFEDLSFVFSESAVPSTINLFADITDADGDPLFIESVVGLDPFEVFLNVDRTAGTYDLSGADFNLAVGETDVQTFTIVVGDGQGGFVERDVSITIEGENDAPEFQSDPPLFRRTEDQGVQLFDLLADVTDFDGDTMTATVRDITNNFDTRLQVEVIDGRYLRIDGRQYEYLGQGDRITNRFEVTVEDGNGGTETFQIRVDMDGVNDLPVITREGRFFDYDILNYANNQQGFFIEAGEVFSDLDGSPDVPAADSRFLTIEVLEDPDGLLLPASFDSSGNVIFDPSALDDLLAPGERRTFTISFTGETGDGDGISGTFQIEVEGTNGVGQPTKAEPDSSGKADIVYIEPVRDPDAIEGTDGKSDITLIAEVLSDDFSDFADSVDADALTPVSGQAARIAMLEGLYLLGEPGTGERLLVDVMTDDIWF